MEDLPGLFLSVGSPAPFSMPQEGCKFEFTENGAIIVCALNRPTPAEIQSFKPSSPFQIRYVRIDGVLFFLFKFGAMPWMDAPYDIRLSQSVALPDLSPGEGYALTVVLVDQATSIVKELRLIGLGERFSRDLREELFSDAGDPLFLPQYYAKVDSIFRRNSTAKLVQLAHHYYKLQ